MADNLNKTIEDIVGKKIEWFDYHKLDSGQKDVYFKDAQWILNNQTFNNELEHYKAELIKLCATMNGIPISTDKLIILQNIQFGIVVLETLKQRFGAIEEPRSSLSSSDPFEVI